MCGLWRGPTSDLTRTCVFGKMGTKDYTMNEYFMLLVLSSGAEIVGRVNQEKSADEDNATKGLVFIEKPHVIQLMQRDGGIGIALIPYVPYALHWKEGVPFNLSTCVAMDTPNMDLVNGWRQMTSNIVVPDNNTKYPNLRITED
jgi:hypothetical protein